MDVIKTQQVSSRPIEKVIVHPLVLLSIVDNYNRVAKDTRKRVVGVLLGSSFKGVVDVSNSYAGLGAFPPQHVGPSNRTRNFGGVSILGFAQASEVFCAKWVFWCELM